MAFAMTAVAIVAIAVERSPLPISAHSGGALGVGAMVGVASVAYFLGLRGLPVSVAAAASNTYIVVTVLLSALVLHQPLTKMRSGAIALTLCGITLLVVGAG